MKRKGVFIYAATIFLAAKSVFAQRSEPIPTRRYEGFIRYNPAATPPDTDRILELRCDDCTYDATNKRLVYPTGNDTSAWVWGNGINKSGNNISVDILSLGEAGAGNGLTFSSGELTIKACSDALPILRFNEGANQWQCSTVGSYVDLTSAQTIGGNKTFTSPVAAYSSLFLPATTATDTFGIVFQVSNTDGENISINRNWNNIALWLEGVGDSSYLFVTRDANVDTNAQNRWALTQGGDHIWMNPTDANTAYRNSNRFYRTGNLDLRTTLYSLQADPVTSQNIVASIINESVSTTAPNTGFGGIFQFGGTTQTTLGAVGGVAEAARLEFRWDNPINGPNLTGSLYLRAKVNNSNDIFAELDGTTNRFRMSKTFDLVGNSIFTTAVTLNTADLGFLDTWTSEGNGNLYLSGMGIITTNTTLSAGELAFLDSWVTNGKIDPSEQTTPGITRTCQFSLSNPTSLTHYHRNTCKVPNSAIVSRISCGITTNVSSLFCIAISVDKIGETLANTAFSPSWTAITTAAPSNRTCQGVTLGTNQILCSSTTVPIISACGSAAPCIRTAISSLTENDVIALGFGTKSATIPAWSSGEWMNVVVEYRLN